MASSIVQIDCPQIMVRDFVMYNIWVFPIFVSKFIELIQLDERQCSKI